jgi:predicted transcriptional regulator
MLIKSKLFEIIDDIPDEKFCNIESLFEEIILFDKLENSLQAAAKGEVYTEEEIDQIISKW